MYNELKKIVNKILYSKYKEFYSNLDDEYNHEIDLQDLLLACETNDDILIGSVYGNFLEISTHETFYSMGSYLEYDLLKKISNQKEEVYKSLIEILK